LIGQRPDSLGQQAQGLNEDGNLAALGSDDFSRGFDDVAKVEQIGFGITEAAIRGVSGLDEVAAQEELQLAGLVLDMGEGERALLAPGHQSPGHGGGLAFQAGEIIKNGFGKMGPFAAGRIGIEAHFAQGFGLGNTAIANFYERIGSHNLTYSVFSRPEVTWSCHKRSDRLVKSAVNYSKMFQPWIGPEAHL
jgi:hypothetical protein